VKDGESGVAAQDTTIDGVLTDAGGKERLSFVKTGILLVWLLRSWMLGYCFEWFCNELPS